MFVDLARAGLGDRLGVVDFDHLVTTDMLLTPVTDTPPSSRTTAKTAINQLVPRGATSIGGGIEAARTAFAAGGGGTARKVLVLVTDGIENQPPFVKGGTPADPRVDLTLYTGITMYTVGLGLGVHVDLGVLTSLATTFRGAFYLTEDRWLSLPKFFVEIFCDTIDEFVMLDPEFELTGPVPFEIDVPIGREDTGFTFTLFWQNRQLPLDFQLVSAAGTKIDPTIAGSHPEVRYGGGSGYAFYRAALPLATSLGGAWDGVWKLIVSAPLAAGQTAKFGITVLVSSNLGIECEMLRASDATGESVAFVARVTEYGISVAPDSLELELDSPAYSRGDLLATVQPEGGIDVPADFAPAAIRDRLAWGIQHDPRFLGRRRQRLKVEADRDGNLVVLRAVVPQVALEGSYHYRFVAEVVRNGLRLRRECAHSFAAIAYPARETTDVVLTPQRPIRKSRRYLVSITPRDIVGNRLGPGLDLDVAIVAKGAAIGPLADRGDGSYAVVLTVAAGRERAVQIGATIRGHTMKWTWKQLTYREKRPGGARVEPPGTTPIR